MTQQLPPPLRLLFVHDKLNDPKHRMLEMDYKYDTRDGNNPLDASRIYGKGIGGGVHITFATTLQDVNDQLQRSRQFDALLVHKDLLLHTDRNAYTALINNRTLNPQELRPYAWLMDRVDAKCRIVMSGEYPDGSKTVISDGADVYMDGTENLMPSIRYALQIPTLYDPRNYGNRAKGVLSIGDANIPLETMLSLLSEGKDPRTSPNPTWMKYVVTDRDGFTPLIEGVPIQYLDEPPRIEHRGGRREGD